jgi:hypothetical protein
MTPEQWAELLVKHAPALRAAGVLELSMEGVTVRFAPPPPPPPMTTPPPPPASGRASTELDDPLSSIPGYTLSPEDAQ